jgi:RNA polymerase sigma-70 factor (family 1)
MSDYLSHILVEEKDPRPSFPRDLLYLVEKNKPKVANPVTLVEKVLISKLIIGDYAAFSVVFNAYYKDLVMFASRFTHELDHAEEIVQDTFVRLWEEHESLKINISLKSYLLKIVQNKCIDWYRHKKIIQSHNKSVLERPIQFDYATDSYILHSELQEQIDLALGMLPEEVSEVFRLNRYKGVKYHDIAELMNVSVRTIEVRMGKALNMLRSQLKEYFVIIGTIIMISGMLSG